MVRGNGGVVIETVRKEAPETPTSGHFMVSLWLHSNAGTDQPEGWTTFEFSGFHIPAMIIEHILDRADYPGSHWGDVFWTHDGSQLTLELDHHYIFRCEWRITNEDGVVITLHGVTRLDYDNGQA